MENKIEVTLGTPIIRGEQTISTISIRKPLGGDLRGIALMDLLNMKIDALEVILPRITTPVLNANDIREMDIMTISEIFAGVFSFLPQNSTASMGSLDA